MSSSDWRQYQIRVSRFMCSYSNYEKSVPRWRCEVRTPFGASIDEGQQGDSPLLPGFKDRPAAIRAAIETAQAHAASQDLTSSGTALEFAEELEL